MKIKQVSATSVWLFVVLVTSHWAAAQNTAFTYQGRLTANGTPQAGSSDLTFTLYDAASGGNVIGGPLTNSAASDANGVFTVTLDFGSTPFEGQPRWLQIGVRPNGGGAFTILTPRQPLTANPYALYAATPTVQGQPGAPGSVWREGSGAPSNSTGVDGDYYLDGSIGNVYLRSSGNYAVVANIKGAQGQPGINGLNGQNGLPGAPGSVWREGSGAPANSTGIDGVDAVAADPEPELLLVGRTAEIEAALGSASRDRLSIHDASEVVEMEEHVNAVRAKRDASINVATRLVAEGEAEGVVSAGNSGAIMAAAIFGLRRLHGLERPAIGARIPTKTGFVFMLDAGANADVKASYLEQFALLGDAYSRRVMGIEKPRVALLSNGEEEGKGNATTVEAYELLKAAPINFTGNVEGKEMFSGSVDVVVTDGFTGNVVLKTLEGIADFLFSTIRSEAKKTPLGIAGGLLLKPSIGNIRARVDWRKIGGAPLLGVNGVVIIAHGRSDAEATKNAIARAAEAVRSGLVEAMADAIRAPVAETPHPTSPRERGEEIVAS